ncbi:MAG: NAD-dependent epimerase/dehydratase family protein [Gammaproteobacteria bacterium]|nr:NAD-dependent epimerase/dehydratase family protein [Gammaproteobacteria bacterium]
MKILITGVAGFIGAHCAHRLLLLGHEIVGIDNFNNYYSVQLKKDRIDWITTNAGAFKLHSKDIGDKEQLIEIFNNFRPDYVLHLAAQAGVRYSIENPDAYLESNLKGFLNILEACRAFPVKHLIYASSSSVYGANQSTPYDIDDGVNHPLSLYAATKKANELMAHSYSHLYKIPCTGLRFFTVYGPWGRPDMSPFLFTDAIQSGKKLKLFNYGNHQRDFTYIDDIVESITRLLQHPPQTNPDWDAKKPAPSTSAAPWRILNIGGSQPIELLNYVALIERFMGKKAELELLPLQPGDVLATSAETKQLESLINFKPMVSIEKGLEHYTNWFKSYYL